VPGGAGRGAVLQLPPLIHAARCRRRPLPHGQQPQTLRGQLGGITTHLHTM